MMRMWMKKILEMVSKKIILRKHFYLSHVMEGNNHLDYSVMNILIFFYSRRHLRRLAMNALAIVSEKGRPTIFLTVSHVHKNITFIYNISLYSLLLIQLGQKL